MLFTTLWVQDYVVPHWPALCTTRLCCAPWCTRGTYVQCKFVLIRWCTWRFHTFVINIFLMVHNAVLSVSVCVGLWELCCTPLQWYRAKLCTTDLVVYQGAQGGPVFEKYGLCTNVHFGAAQRSFVLIRWCTRWFCMNVISNHPDGAQCDVVSLALSVCEHSHSRTVWSMTLIFGTGVDLDFI